MNCHCNNRRCDAGAEPGYVTKNRIESYSYVTETHRKQTKEWFVLREIQTYIKQFRMFLKIIWGIKPS